MLIKPLSKSLIKQIKSQIIVHAFTDLMIVTFLINVSKILTIVALKMIIFPHWQQSVLLKKCPK